MEPDKERRLPQWMLYGMIALAACSGMAVLGWNAIAPILVVGGALTLVAVHYRESDKLLRKSQEHELDPPILRDSEEAKNLNHELAALAFCIGELEIRAASSGLHDWIWKDKLRVARVIRQEWTDRIDWECDAKLTDDDKETLLAEHPLLQNRNVDMLDPAERYANEDWYRQIRSEVMQFVTGE